MAVVGSVSVSTNLDNSGVHRSVEDIEKSLKSFGARTSNAFAGTSKSVEKVKQQMSETKIAMENVKQQMRAIEKAGESSGNITSKAYNKASLDVGKTHIALDNLERKMLEIKKTKESELSYLPYDTKELDIAVNKLLESDKQYQKLGDTFDSLIVKLEQQQYAQEQAKQTAINSSGTQSAEYKKLESKLSDLNVRMQQYNSRLHTVGQASMATNQATHTLGDGMERLKNRISRLAVGVFVFNVLRKGFTSLRTYLFESLKTNVAFSQSLSQIKGNLLTAFQPLNDLVTPYIINFVKWVQKATAYIAVFTSALAGKTVKQSAKAAKNLNEQAKAMKEITKTTKEAKGAIAGFDEINQLSKSGLADGDNLPSIELPKEDLNPDYSGLELPESVITSIENFADKIKSIWTWIVEYQPEVTLALALFGIACLVAFGPSVITKIVGFALLMIGIGKIIETVQQIIADGGITWETFIDLINGVGIAIIGLGLLLGKPKVAGFGLILWGVSQGLETITEYLKGNIGYWEAFSDTLKYVGVVIIALGAIMGKPRVAGFGLILWGISELIKGLTGIISGNEDAWESLKRIMMGSGLIIAGVFLTLGSGAGIAALAIGALVVAVSAVASVWGKLSAGEKILAGIGIAALAAAVAIAIFHTSWSVGLAAAAIGLALAGLAATFVAVKGKLGIGGGKSNFSVPTSGASSLKTAQSFGAQNFSASPLPHLARGAVIPANKEFMAVLGDQRHGTNIETPEGLLRSIFSEELQKYGGGDITLETTIVLEDGTIIKRAQKTFSRQSRLAGATI